MVYGVMKNKRVLQNHERLKKDLPNIFKKQDLDVVI